MTHTAFNILALYILAINFIGFMAFNIDKAAARNGDRRISENTLLLIAMMGGALGSVLGQRIFRHKTRKQPFKALLYTVIIFQTMLVFAIIVAPIRNAVLSVF